jgi:predicted secreted Zn-dependent protease
VIVSLPRRSHLWLIAASLAVALILACGGDKGNDDTSGGAETETRSELNSREPEIRDIELDTSLEKTYYDVEGTTTESIFSHIERNGPTDGEGKRGSGLTSVVWGYEWQGGPESASCPACDSECSIRSMTIKAEMVVTLPQHVDEDSLPPEIRGEWDAYAGSVAQHEQTHVDIYLDGAGAMREAMLAIGPMASCDELEVSIEQVWDEQQAQINNQQAVFHQQEFDRLAQQRAPIAAQIDANRAKINDLRSQVTTLDGVVTALRNEIDSLITAINDVDAQIKEINESSESSEDKQAKLIVLIQHRNALQASHNNAVDEHNAALAQREPVVAQRNQLINATNDLVDEFNWTR